MGFKMTLNREWWQRARLSLLWRRRPLYSTSVKAFPLELRTSHAMHLGSFGGFGLELRVSSRVLNYIAVCFIIVELANWEGK